MHNLQLQILHFVFYQASSVQWSVISQVSLSCHLVCLCGIAGHLCSMRPKWSDRHSFPPIGSRISSCSLFLLTCIIAALLTQSLADLLGTTIPRKTLHQQTSFNPHLLWHRRLHIPDHPLKSCDTWYYSKEVLLTDMYSLGSLARHRFSTEELFIKDQKSNMNFID